MKSRFLFVLPALILAGSCDLLDPGSAGKSKESSIQIHFNSIEEVPQTRASKPDTNDFILSVTDAKGAVVYSGTFGAAPEKIIVTSGSYTVSAKSCEFTTPLFDCPQYGDTKVVVVKEGENCSVTLDCAQINSGVKLSIDSAFLTEYPNAVLFLKSADGKLMYGYSEQRIAYFRPGSVALILYESLKETTICTRTLAEKEVLHLKVDVSNGATESGAGIHIAVDTSRVWMSESVVIGGSNDDNSGGSDKSNAYSVSKAKEHIGETDVWVYGYIVGGDLSSSRCSFEAPFSSKTNLAIAAKSTCTDKESCLSVQLQSGKIRDALNLVDNEHLLGKKVYLKGDIVEAYYGIPGIQSITEYDF